MLLSFTMLIEHVHIHTRYDIPYEALSGFAKYSIAANVRRAYCIEHHTFAVKSY
jgi:hypothetical protein